MKRTPDLAPAVQALALGLLLNIAHPQPLLSAETDPPVRVIVDPRVELISILFRLAGNPEYGQGRVMSYSKDVDEHFGPFQQHQAVKIAAELRRKRGVSYDACMSMVVHLTDAWELAEKVPLSPRPESLDARWQPDEARAFLEAARQFVRETQFKAFFEKHQTLYETTQSRMQNLLEKESHVDWFDRFFGAHPGARFTVALGLLNGGQCYGPYCRNADGTEDLFCILGVWLTDEQGLPRFTSEMLKTVVHEFCHSYANPIIDRHAGELKAAGEAIFPHVEATMRRQAYGHWRTVLCESLVRASTLRYIRTYEGEAAAQAEARGDQARGFLWIDKLATLLSQYEADRKQYPTMEAFAPRLIDFFNKVARELPTQLARYPKISSANPADGQTGVDPSVSKIVVIFDRPMRDGSWSMVGGGPHCPEVTGQAGYDDKHTTWSVPVKLKPNWTYRYMLNSDRAQGFKSEDGTPLQPVSVTFTTGDGDPGK